MSMRSVSYGVFAFGFVGGVLHVLGLARPGVALAVGLLAGAAGHAGVVGLTFRELGDPTRLGAGRLPRGARRPRGRVLVACARGPRGKVRVTLKGQTVDMLATTDEEDDPGRRRGRDRGGARRGGPRRAEAPSRRLSRWKSGA